jgi:hypothetical protein
MNMEYEAAVKEGKQMLAQEEKNQWRWGEIASTIEPKYGEATLATYAEEVGIDHGTLENYRTTWEAWKQMPPRGGFSFTAAKTLNAHPKRFEIAKKNPELTYREATIIMNQYNQHIAARRKPMPKPIPVPNSPNRRKNSENDLSCRERADKCIDVAKNATIQAQEFSDVLNPVLDNIDPFELNACIEAAVEALNEWQKAIQIAKEKQTRKGSHLKVVKE